MNKQQIIDYLYDMKATLERQGLIPTIDLVIEDLEEGIKEEITSTDPTTVAEEMDDDSADIN